jgi:hypothetical protein
MAYQDSDPYEQAKLRASLESIDPASKRVKEIKDIPAMRSYRQPLEGTGDSQDYLDVDSDEYEQALEDPLAPADLFSGRNSSYVDIPTSTTNARRPRTVAAAYAPNRLGKGRGIITVVFRDGTVWNYFGKGGTEGNNAGITPGEWLNFRNSISKGKPWINQQVFGYGAPANTSFIDPEVQSRIYEVAREYQLSNYSVRKYRAADQSKKTKARVQRVGKMAAKRAQREFRGTTRKQNGTNPSNGGKNPF